MLMFSVHVASSARLSILGRGSFLFGPSSGVFFFPKCIVQGSEVRGCHNCAGCRKQGNDVCDFVL